MSHEPVVEDISGSTPLVGFVNSALGVDWHFAFAAAFTGLEPSSARFSLT